MPPAPWEPRSGTEGSATPAAAPVAGRLMRSWSASPAISPPTSPSAPIGTAHSPSSSATPFGRCPRARQDLWARRRDDPAAYLAVVGRGEQLVPPVLAGATTPQDPVGEAWALVEAASIIPDMPVTVDLGPGEMVGIVGPATPARALLRSLVLQLVAAHGPADLLVAGLAGPTGPAGGEVGAVEGSWLAWLPHTEHPGGGERLVAAGTEVDAVLAGLDRSAEPSTSAHLLLVVEDPSLLAARNTSARRLLARDPSAAALVVADDVAALPSTCRTVVQLRADGSASIQRPGHDGLAEHVRPAGASLTTACRVARGAGRSPRSRAARRRPELSRPPSRSSTCSPVRSTMPTRSEPTGAPRATILRSARDWRWLPTVRWRSISSGTDLTCSWPERPARARASSSGR